MRHLAVTFGLLAALAAPVGALAGTPQENADAAATLKPLVKAKFAKVAPKLSMQKITCVTLKDGVTARCKAVFTYAPAKAFVTYAITSKLHDLGGKLTWTTTGHTCKDEKTGKALAC